MFNQSNVREKIQVIRGEVRSLIGRIQHRIDSQASNQPDGVVDADNFPDRSDMHEYSPDGDDNLESRKATVANEGVILSDGVSDNQDLVWDNDEAIQAADEDDKYEPRLEFEEDSGSGQWNRYN